MFSTRYKRVYGEESDDDNDDLAKRYRLDDEEASESPTSDSEEESEAEEAPPDYVPHLCTEYKLKGAVEPLRVLHVLRDGDYRLEQTTPVDTLTSDDLKRILRLTESKESLESDIPRVCDIKRGDRVDWIAIPEEMMENAKELAKFHLLEDYTNAWILEYERVHSLVALH